MWRDKGERIASALRGTLLVVGELKSEEKSDERREVRKEMQGGGREENPRQDGKIIYLG